MTQKQVPQFQSYEEEARFWDSHDATDYFEFQRPRLNQGITIRLDAATLEAINWEARARGVGPSTLLRMWIRDRLGSRHVLTGAPPSASPRNMERLNPDIQRRPADRMLMAAAETGPAEGYGGAPAANPHMMMSEESAQYVTSKPPRARRSDVRRSRPKS